MTELEVVDECVLVETCDVEEEISVLGDKELLDGCDISMFNREEILEEASDTVFFILLTKSFTVVDVTKEDVSFTESESSTEVSNGSTLFEVSSSLFPFLIAFTSSVGFSKNNKKKLRMKSD